MSSGVNYVADRKAEGGGFSQDPVIDSGTEGVLGQGLKEGIGLLAKGMATGRENTLSREVVKLDRLIAEKVATGTNKVELGTFRLEYIKGLINNYGFNATDARSIVDDAKKYNLKTVVSADGKTAYQVDEDSNNIYGQKAVPSSTPAQPSYMGSFNSIVEKNERNKGLNPNMLAAFNSGIGAKIFNGETNDANAAQAAAFGKIVTERSVDIGEFLKNLQDNRAFSGEPLVAASQIDQNVRENKQQLIQKISLFRQTITSKILADLTEDPVNTISTQEIESVFKGIRLDISDKWNNNLQQQTGVTYEALQDILKKEEKIVADFAGTILAKGETTSMTERTKMFTAKRVAEEALDTILTLNTLSDSKRALIRQYKLGLIPAILSVVQAATPVGDKDAATKLYFEILDPTKRLVLNEDLTKLEELSGDVTEEEIVTRFLNPLSENSAFAQAPAQAQRYMGILDNLLGRIDKDNTSLIKKIKEASEDFKRRFKFLRVEIAKHPNLKKVIDAK
tara:strand:+ start:7350 stop:8873 length:1524 start_codon:yes stop_codon:yes gene_type:complete